MGLRRARELVVLMAKEFQPYGATWAELMHKSGSKPTSYTAVASVKSNFHTETGALGLSSDPVRTLDSSSSNIDSVVALASEAIRYVDQKKRSEG